MAELIIILFIILLQYFFIVGLLYIKIYFKNKRILVEYYKKHTHWIDRYFDILVVSTQFFVSCFLIILFLSAGNLVGIIALFLYIFSFVIVISIVDIDDLKGIHWIKFGRNIGTVFSFKKNTVSEWIFKGLYFVIKYLSIALVILLLIYVVYISF